MKTKDEIKAELYVLLEECDYKPGKFAVAMQNMMFEQDSTDDAQVIAMISIEIAREMKAKGEGATRH